VSWLAPVDGVMNVWVAPTGALAAAQPVTRERRRGLDSYSWTPDGQHIIYEQDSGGDENFRLIAVDIATRAEVALTAADSNVRAEFMGMSKDRPGIALVGLNGRDPRLFDLYEVDYRSGASRLVFTNPGYGHYMVDRQLRPRFGMKQEAGGSATIQRIERDGTATKAWDVPVDDYLPSQTLRHVLHFSRDGGSLYLLDSRGRDKAALVKVDTTTLATQVLATSDRADIEALLIDPATDAPIAYAVNYLTTEWTPLTAQAKDDLDFLKEKLPGELSFLSSTDDGTKLIVAADAADAPGATFLYDRRAKSLVKLYDSRPDLAAHRLRPMQPIEINSTDGKTLVGYLTLPADADRDGDGKADRPVPMIVYVHGGPWLRDSYGFRGEHQWLADRGYAVLSVNYRGSSGFGKGFLNAANGEWAGKIHQDLIDGVDWAVRNGITRRDTVAIMGASYGGYATLVGVTFTPDRFRCGVDMVGPSNIRTLLASFPEYWRPFLEATFHRQVGDPARPEDVTRMMAQSPISRVDAIRVPLLIGQGQNDPRVVKAESDQIVAAMKAKALPVTYLVYPDEGHGFHRPENKLSFFAVAEGFLSKCLGGKAEPIGGDFSGSTVQVPEGADHVPGLAEALDKARR
jgi:dipeptidyl aminopeptidase/acylaminoacyl peptidase